MPWLNSALTCGLHEILNETEPSLDSIDVSAMRPMRAMLSSGLGLPMEPSGSAQPIRRKAGTVSIVMNFMASSLCPSIVKSNTAVRKRRNKRQRRPYFARLRCTVVWCGRAGKIQAALQFKPGDSPINTGGSAPTLMARAARHFRWTAPPNPNPLTTPCLRGSPANPIAHSERQRLGGAGFSDPVPQDDGAAFTIPVHL